MKTPDRCRTGSQPSAEGGPTELYFGVSYYRRPTIGASPTTFHTVSEREFCELRLYGVLRSWHVCGHIIILGAALPVHVRRYGSSQGAPVLAFERNLQAFRPLLTRAPPEQGSAR